MAHSKAYDPQYGYRYQLLTRNISYSREWEHCDYALNYKDRAYLLQNYREAYGPGWEFKTIELPKKYWNESTKKN